MRAQESAARLSLLAPYEEFRTRVQRIGAKLREWLRAEREQGREISVYGASTKGNTLLQIYGLDHTLIRSAAERNPEKWGKFTGGHLDPHRLRSRSPLPRQRFSRVAVALHARNPNPRTRLPGPRRQTNRPPSQPPSHHTEGWHRLA